MLRGIAVSPANHQAADKVWAAIEALQVNNAKLKLSSVRVVAATPDGFDVEATEDSQKADIVDVHVKLAAHTPSPPAKGAIVTVVGRLTGYTPPPPFSFTLEQAELAP